MANPEKRPKVGLFATCLVDLMRPSVGFAAASLIERAGFLENEKVLVANINNGARFETYVIVGEEKEIKLNGAAAKPARELKPGDRLHIRTEGEDWEVDVLGFNAQRRPAAEARLLYRETPESLKKRAEAAELRRLAPLPQADAKGRPTKRDRRQLSRLRGGL